MQRNRADVPDLAHAGNHAGDAEAEGDDGSDAKGQLGGLVVVRGVVTAEAALEDEVVGEGDALVDGELAVC